MRTIFEYILIFFNLFVLVGYFLGFISIFFQQRFIEGSVLLIAIAIVDKVNEDRNKANLDQ